ncbi:MAG TPA: hypothetical protein VNV42_12635 [Solirubrobacteraceae bacterium]|nr:hypothetical protein [Solirubrobacteraceae bacterium]
MTVLWIALPATAGAQTFGPNLSTLEPDNKVGCEVNPFLGGPIAASSCTWSSNVPLGEDATNPNGAQIPPGGDGTISQVSVKVGPITGPMQVEVLREELEFVEVGTPNVHARVSCCDAIEQSQVFTPTANSITSEAVDLPVEVEEHPNPQTGLLTADILGLSVLSDKVPVPAVDERALLVLDQAGTDAWAPAITQGQQVLADEQTGYLVLMDAVWNPAPSATPIATPTPTPAPTPKSSAAPPVPTLSFPAGALARIKGTGALVNLDCGAAAACDGTVRIQSAPGGQAAAVLKAARAAGHKGHKRTAKHHKSAVITYASGSFSLAAGQSQAVDAKLSSTGKQFARKHKRLKVWVVVTLSNTTPAKVSSQAVTLKF